MNNINLISYATPGSIQPGLTGTARCCFLNEFQSRYLNESKSKMKQQFYTLCIALIASQASVSDGLSVAVGGFDISGDSIDTAVQLEYAPEQAWAGFRPHAGLFVTEQSTAYAYVGVAYPLPLGARWSLAPSISAGYYHQGGGQDLGRNLQFYSQLQLRYRFSDTANLAVAVGHISNANLADENPGANTAFLSYATHF